MGKRLKVAIPVGMVIVVALIAGLAGAAPGGRANGFAPGVWASPLSIDFGVLPTGDMSDPIPVTITNSGGTFISPFEPGGLSAPFLRNHNCDAGLFPGATCQVFFIFAPETDGSFAATAAVPTEFGTFNIALRGASEGPVLRVSPLSFDFGSVRAGQSGAPQVAMLTNDGRTHLDFNGITAPSAPFSVVPNCAGGLAPNASCPVQFDFSPAAAGIFAEIVEIDTPGGVATIQLMGRGRDEVNSDGQRVTPRSLDFGPVPVGSTSAALTVRVTNESITDHLVDWQQAALVPPFAATTNCQDDIDPSTFCDYTYTFSPAEAGEFATSHTITNNRGTFQIALRGTGVGPEISTDKLVLEFGPVAPGEISPTQVVTVRNTGKVPLPAMFGGAPNPAVFGASTTCGGLLAPGASCVLNYTFNPTALGRYEGSSVVALDPQAKQTLTIELRGGAAFPELAVDFQPAAVDPGETATLRFTIANPNETISLTNVEMNAVLSPGLVVADPPLPNLGPGCSGSFQPVAGGSAVAYSGNLTGGETCVLEVKVVANEKGTYTVNATAASDSGDSEPAAATLYVGDVAGFELFLPFVRR